MTLKLKGWPTGGSCTLYRACDASKSSAAGLQQQGSAGTDESTGRVTAQHKKQRRFLSAGRSCSSSECMLCFPMPSLQRLPGYEGGRDLPSGCTSWQDLDVQPCWGLLLYHHGELLEVRAILLQLGTGKIELQGCSSACSHRKTLESCTRVQGCTQAADSAQGPWRLPKHSSVHSLGMCNRSPVLLTL